MESRNCVILGALLLVALVAGACGSGKTGSQEGAAQAGAAGAPGALPGDVTPLELMGWPSAGAEAAHMQTLIDGFNAANPGIHVTISLPANYDAHLAERLAAGDLPDVFYLDSFRFSDFQAAGALAAVGDRMTNPTDFYPALAQTFSADGRLYCAPRDFSTLALYYNRKMFAAAEVAEPTARWTWDDLRTAAEALSFPEKGIYGIAIDPDMARWAAFLYQAGGALFDAQGSRMALDSPAARAALDYYAGFVDNGMAASASYLDARWPGEAFARGRSAMVVEGNWLAPYLAAQFADVDYGIVELPAGPAGKATLAFASCYAVAASGRNQAAATRLVDYLAGPASMQELTDGGLAIPARPSLAAEWVARFPARAPLLAGLEYAAPWQFAPGFQAVVDAFNRALDEAFAGNLSTDDVLESVNAAGNKLLAR